MKFQILFVRRTSPLVQVCMAHHVLETTPPFRTNFQKRITSPAWKKLNLKTFNFRISPMNAFYRRSNRNLLPKGRYENLGTKLEYKTKTVDAVVYSIKIDSC